MRILLDEHLGLLSQELLNKAGYDTQRIYTAGIAGASDEEVWQYACAKGMLLITLDTDFSDYRRYTPPFPGVLLLRPHSNSAVAVNELLTQVLRQYNLEEFRNCLVVSDNNKTRIRRFPESLPP